MTNPFLRLNHWNRRTAKTDSKEWEKNSISWSFPYMFCGFLITEWRKIWSVSEKCCSFDSVKCLSVSSRWLSFLHICINLQSINIFLFLFGSSVLPLRAFRYFGIINECDGRVRVPCHCVCLCVFVCPCVCVDGCALILLCKLLGQQRARATDLNLERSTKTSIYSA